MADFKIIYYFVLIKNKTLKPKISCSKCYKWIMYSGKMDIHFDIISTLLLLLLLLLINLVFLKINLDC